MFILLLSRLLFFQSDLLLESTGVLKIHFQSLKIQNFFMFSVSFHLCHVFDAI